MGNSSGHSGTFQRITRSFLMFEQGCVLAYDGFITSNCLKYRNPIVADLGFYVPNGEL